MGATSEITDLYTSNSYEVSVTLTKDLFERANYVIHDAVPEAIMQHLDRGDEEFLEIFPIYEPCRILSEGYEFENGIVAEDFAISGSYNGGELIIGQFVSSNGKETYNGKPRDFIQAENFEQQIKADQSISSALKKVYSIRTKIPDKRVEEKESAIKQEVEEKGEYNLDLEVFELKTSDKLSWEDAFIMLEKF